MKLPIVGRGVPSALFVFTTKNGEYELVRRGETSDRLIQLLVEVISKKMLTTTWIYFDGLLYAGHLRSGAARTLNLFDVPLKESMISGFSEAVAFTPETFFQENEPGLVVAPFAAINLGSSVEVIMVVRDRETPVNSNDVKRSLRSFTEAEGNETPFLLPETVSRMAERIRMSLDFGAIEVEGRKLNLSIGFKVQGNLVVTPKPKAKPFTIKPKATSRGQSASAPQTSPLWPSSTTE
jgi:hypothetical protein